jgi:hypothetical protein
MKINLNSASFKLPSVFSKVILSLLLLFYFTGYGQQTKKWTPNGTGYLEYLPPSYEQLDSFPAIIFLHGSGERGSGSESDLNKVMAQGPPKLIKNGHNMCFAVNGKTECFIVLSPQTIKWSWRGDVIPFVKYVLESYKIDPNRIYLTGLSMGGEGAWFGASHDDNVPNHFAAIGVMAGRASYQDGINVANRGIAVWAFHGDKDTAIPINSGRNPINGMKSILSSTPPIFTILQGGNHNKSWEIGYKTDHSVFDLNLFEWFLMQRRTPIKNLPPIVDAGPKQTITLPTPLTLKGSARDPEGMPLAKVTWSQTKGAATVIISSPDSLETPVLNVIPGTYSFRLTCEDQNGSVSTAYVNIDIASQQMNKLTVADKSMRGSSSAQLRQSYPNPVVNTQTIIPFKVNTRQMVVVKIFDITGNEIQTVISKELEPGFYEIPININQKGIYFYRMFADGEIQSKQILKQ